MATEVARRVAGRSGTGLDRSRLREGLGSCVDDEADGRARLTVTLPDKPALDQMAQTLAPVAGGCRSRGCRCSTTARYARSQQPSSPVRLPARVRPSARRGSVWPGAIVPAG